MIYRTLQAGYEQVFLYLSHWLMGFYNGSFHVVDEYKTATSNLKVDYLHSRGGCNYSATHAGCACATVFTGFWGGDGQSVAAVVPLRSTCKVQVPAANPAGGWSPASVNLIICDLLRHETHPTELL